MSWNKEGMTGFGEMGLDTGQSQTRQCSRFEPGAREMVQGLRILALPEDLG